MAQVTAFFYAREPLRDTRVMRSADNTRLDTRMDAILCDRRLYAAAYQHGLYLAILGGRILCRANRRAQRNMRACIRLGWYGALVAVECLCGGTAFGLDPVPFALTEHVDRLTISHVYDAEGRHALTQYLFEEWMPHEGTYRVRDWRLAKGPERPLRDAQRDQWTLTWRDGRTMRRVLTHDVKERWDGYDPELEDRLRWPMETRRGLLSQPAAIRRRF